MSARIRPFPLLALLTLMACGDDDGSAADAAVDAAPVDMGFDAGPPPEPRAAPRPYVDLVDPLIGSGGLGFGVGSSSIAPQTPFGMARPGPDTAGEGGALSFAHCSGYYYTTDTFIWGFSQIRPHGMGVPDYGNVALMPTDGMSAEKTDQMGYRVGFSHDDETVEVGYYGIDLADGIRAELTASDHVAHHRYTFPESVTDPTVIVDVGHVLATPNVEPMEGTVTIDPEAQEVRGLGRIDGGYSGRFGGVGVYFVARFDQPFASHGTFLDGALTADGTEVTGAKAGAYLGFDAATVNVKVGISFVDEAHAAMNLDAEDGTFEATREATVAAWEELLGRVEVTGRYDDDFTLFYTALYHVLLMPTLASDVDGAYRGIDGEVHATGDEGEAFRYSTDFSLWDTFRTQTPLLVLLYPELMGDQLRSLVRMARDGGYMPRWPLGHGYTGGMVGDSADLVFADAHVKGALPMPASEAYAALRPTAFGPTATGSAYGGRRGITDYVALGYVPNESAGAAASATLEFAYDDWGLAFLADAAGESADADALRERAGNWRNLWDPATEYLIGRNADGSFPAELNDRNWEDFYAEGNARQYLWYVPHQLDELVEQLGGWDVAKERLDGFMEGATRRTTTLYPPNDYWHGNEPDIHAPWIYAAMDEPSETARWTRWITRTLYGTGPDGLPGNDDSGTLSAWLVMSMLGFYPITGWDHYLLSAPFFTEATVHLPGGDVTIEAPNSHDYALTVDELSWNGEPLERARISHEAFAAGGTFRAELR